MDQPLLTNVAASDMTSIVLALSVPVVSGIVGAIGLMLRDWREKRSIDHRRAQKLEHAQLKIQVLTAWTDASRKIGAPPRAGRPIEALLAECLDEVEEAARMQIVQPQATFLRRIFLFIPLRGNRAKFFRLFYLVTLLAITALGVVTVPWLTEMPATGELDTPSVIWTLILFAVLIVTCGALLRRAALAADERERRGRPARSARPRAAEARWRLPNDTP